MNAHLHPSTSRRPSRILGWIVAAFVILLTALGLISWIKTHELRTEIVIDAPADRVWDVLVDFADYPQWNPFITRIEGTPETGARLTADLDGDLAMTITPTILHVEPARELRWLGRLWIPGLLDGEHRFQLEELEPGRTRLVHAEEFRGLLIPLVWPWMADSTEAGFRAMNEALRARAADR